MNIVKTMQDIYYHWEILISYYSTVLEPLQHDDAFKSTNSEADFKSLAAI